MTNREKLHLAVSACGMRTTLEEIIKMLAKHDEKFIVRLSNDLKGALATYQNRYIGEPCGVMVNYQKGTEYGYAACVLPHGHEGNCNTVLDNQS